MKFEFEKFTSHKDPRYSFWFAFHPDTNEIGGGWTKFKAARDLEACTGRRLSVK